MSQLINLTGFGAMSLPSMSREGFDLLLAVCASRFRLPPPGTPEDEPLVLDEIQEDPRMADDYHGEPGRSSLRREGQTAFRKPATDITVSGHARAPGHRPTRQMDVAVAVGHCRQRATVTGDRWWERGLSPGAVKPSLPEPFDRFPLLWEHAFGGSIVGPDGEILAHESRNPVGRGLQHASVSPLGQRLPNIEHPAARIDTPADRPDVVVGFGPIARSWGPRVKLAGSYDEDWRRRRAPLWPVDFDERFFCSACPPLQACPHLSGGEHVSLVGFHAAGAVQFRIPDLHLKARFRFDGHDEYAWMTLDGVDIDTDEGCVTLIHRAAVLAKGGLPTHRETVVRRVARWERSLT